MLREREAAHQGSAPRGTSALWCRLTAARARCRLACIRCRCLIRQHVETRCWLRCSRVRTIVVQCQTLTLPLGRWQCPLHRRRRWSGCPAWCLQRWPPARRLGQQSQKPGPGWMLPAAEGSPGHQSQSGSAQKPDLQVVHAQGRRGACQV